MFNNIETIVDIELLIKKYDIRLDEDYNKEKYLINLVREFVYINKKKRFLKKIIYLLVLFILFAFLCLKNK